MAMLIQLNLYPYLQTNRNIPIDDLETVLGFSKIETFQRCAIIAKLWSRFTAQHVQNSTIAVKIAKHEIAEPLDLLAGSASTDRRAISPGDLNISR